MSLHTPLIEEVVRSVLLVRGHPPPSQAVLDRFTRDTWPLVYERDRLLDLLADRLELYEHELDGGRR